MSGSAMCQREAGVQSNKGCTRCRVMFNKGWRRVQRAGMHNKVKWGMQGCRMRCISNTGDAEGRVMGDAECRVIGDVECEVMGDADCGVIGDAVATGLGVDGGGRSTGGH